MKRKLFCMVVLLFVVTFYPVRRCAVEEMNLNCKNAIVYDRKCKRVLFEKDAYNKVPNASTTKILTAIVVIENCELDEIVEISKNAVNVSGSKVKFRKGDKITVNDLLNGMLLCSGNDAAIALAEHVSGNVHDFCKLMNAKAEEIGAVNTHFISPHGLDEEGHYSTAYDLALIADYALDNQHLARIFAKKTETIYVNNTPRTIISTNEMLYLYDKANGVKTGFTNKAGRCLVTSASNEEEWQIISVVLGCDTKNLRTKDSIKLLDYGFENYKIDDIGKILPSQVVFEVEKSKEKIYKTEINFKYEYPITVEEKEKLWYKEKRATNFVAPLGINTEIAKYEIYIRGFKGYRNSSKTRV